MRKSDIVSLGLDSSSRRSRSYHFDSAYQVLSDFQEKQFVKMWLIVSFDFIYLVKFGYFIFSRLRLSCIFRFVLQVCLENLE